MSHDIYIWINLFTKIKFWFFAIFREIDKNFRFFIASLASLSNSASFDAHMLVVQLFNFTKLAKFQKSNFYDFSRIHEAGWPIFLCTHYLVMTNILKRKFLKFFEFWRNGANREINIFQQHFSIFPRLHIINPRSKFVCRLNFWFSFTWTSPFFNPRYFYFFSEPSLRLTIYR